MPSPDYQGISHIEIKSEELGFFDIIRKETKNNKEANPIITKIIEENKALGNSGGKVATSTIEKANSAIYNTFKKKGYNSIQALQNLSQTREKTNIAIARGNINNFGKQVLLNAYIKDPSKVLEAQIITPDYLLTIIAIEKKFDYEHKINKLLSNYNSQYGANLTLSYLQSKIAIEELKSGSSEEDIILAKTPEGKEAIKVRKIEVFINAIQNTIERNKPYPNLARAMIDLTLSENKKQIEEMLINAETSAISNLLEKNLKTIRGRALIKKSDDKDLQNIVALQEIVSQTTRTTNVIDKVLETHHIQETDLKSSGNINNELEKKEDIISGLASIKDDVISDVDKAIATKKEENNKLQIGGLTEQESETIKNNEVLIQALQSQKKAFIEQVSIIEQKYQNDINEIRKSLAQKVEVIVGVKDKIENSIPGLDTIPIKLPNNTIEVGDIPLIVGDYTIQELNKVPEYPLFVGQPQSQQLTQHLALYQRFGRLEKNTSTPLSNTDITTITVAQKKGRPIPFEQNTTPEEKKGAINTFKKKLREGELKGLIERLMFSQLKSFVAQTASNDFISPINQAGQKATTGAFDINQARYDTQGNLNIPRKIIPILGTVQTQTLSTNNGAILYPQLYYDEKDKTFVMQNQAIQNTSSFSELATREASIITSDMLTEALKSKNPQEVIIELYKQKAKIKNDIDIDPRYIAQADTVSMIIDCLGHGHRTQVELSSSSPQTTLSPYQQDLLGLLGEKEKLQPNSTLHTTIESFSKSMKGWSINEYNKFAAALPALGKLLKNPNTEKNITNIVQNNSNSPHVGILASLSESHRSQSSLIGFFSCFTDPNTNEFKLDDFLSTIQSLDFSINQGGGLAELKYSGINNNFITKITSEYTLQHDQQQAENDLDSALANIDDPNIITTFA